MSRSTALLVFALALAGVLLVLLGDQGGDSLPRERGGQTGPESRQVVEALPILGGARPEESVAKKREADFSRMEVRGELADGTIIRGANLMVGGVDRPADIITPEDDGGTYVMGERASYLACNCSISRTSGISYSRGTAKFLCKMARSSCFRFPSPMPA